MSRTALSRAGSLLAVASLALSASGCAVVTHNRYLPAQEFQVRNAVWESADEPGYLRLQLEPGLAARDSGRDEYQLIEAEFAPIPTETGDSIQISASFYRSRIPDTRRLVIVLPIWGSAEFPQRKLVKTLLDGSAGQLNVVELQGVEAMIHWKAMAAVETEAGFISLARDSARRVDDTMTGIRQLIDWLQRHGDYEIDIVGFSMGALVGSMVVGADDRVEGGVFMMGGADPAEILSSCNSRKVEKVRRNAMRRFGWTAAQYRALMSSLFTDGTARTYAGSYKPEKILIIDGVFDGCMNSRSRHALWEATGYPERYRMLSTHRWAFLALTPLSLNSAGRMILDFVSEHPIDVPVQAGGVITASLR